MKFSCEPREAARATVGDRTSADRPPPICHTRRIARRGAASQTTFISDLQNAGVHYYIGGHDHMYNRAVDRSPDGNSSVQDLVAQSDASKFYLPNGEPGSPQRSVDSTGKVTSSGTLATADPTQTNDNIYDVQVVKAAKLAGFTGTTCETPIAQDLNKIGYYIVTVDGPNVTVDYYAAVVNPTLSSGEYLLSSTPWLNFVKEESFGYSLTGKEFFVPQGGSYTQVKGSFHGTTAQILTGSNGSTATDAAGRRADQGCHHRLDLCAMRRPSRQQRVHVVGSVGRRRLVERHLHALHELQGRARPRRRAGRKKRPRLLGQGCRPEHRRHREVRRRPVEVGLRPRHVRRRPRTRAPPGRSSTTPAPLRSPNADHSALTCRR